MNRLLKKLLTVVLTVCMCFGLAACGTSQSSESEAADSSDSQEINIGVFDMATLYLMRTFDDMGYFKENGSNLKFTYFNVYSDAISAFNAHKVDMICYAVAEAVAPVVQGIDCKVIGVFDTSNGLDGIAAAEGINSISDLKGKTVATEIGSVDHMMLQQALEKNGLSESDINVVNMSAGDAIGALASGTIQAVSTWEPQLSMAAKYGSIIYSTQEDPDLIEDVFLIHEDVLNAQHDNVKGFLKTWYKCAGEYTENPDKFAEKAAAYGNISVDEFKSMMDVTRLVTLDENKTAFTEGENDNKYLNVLIRTVGDFLYNGGLVDKEITDDQISNMLDSTIINELIDEK